MFLFISSIRIACCRKLALLISHERLTARARYSFGCLVLLLSVVAVAEPAVSTSMHAVPPLSGKLGAPMQLFNDKDLDGWVWFQKPPKAGATVPAIPVNEVFTVRDNTLYSAGKPTGYLRTEQAFTNFVLTVEQRHLAKGNGGLLVGIGASDKIWPGLEIQTMTGSAGDLWNHNQLKLVTAAARTQDTHVLRSGPDSQQAIGDWDTIEVIIDRGTLVFKVNGVIQNVATDTESLAGRIGLQVEGAAMEFRKVQLTPIEADDR